MLEYVTGFRSVTPTFPQHRRSHKRAAPSENLQRLSARRGTLFSRICPVFLSVAHGHRLILRRRSRKQMAQPHFRAHGRKITGPSGKRPSKNVSNSGFSLLTYFILSCGNQGAASRFMISSFAGPSSMKGRRPQPDAGGRSDEKNCPQGSPAITTSPSPRVGDSARGGQHHHAGGFRGADN